MTAYKPIDFNSLPNTFGDIHRKIDDLHYPFLEMYQREKAVAKWPDYEFVIKLTKSQAFAQQSTGPASEYPGRSFQQNQEHPSRPSSILPFYVPQDATGADEQAIDSAAKTDAGTAITEIRSAFNEVLEDGSLAAVDTLLQKLSTTLESIRHLAETHGRDGFAKVEELFKAWKGKDSEAGAERFGSRLRGAAGFHHMMAADLIQGASAECAAKLTAQTALGKVLDEVHSQIGELTTGTNHNLKMIARTAFGQIPLAGDIVNFINSAYEGTKPKSATPATDVMTKLYNMLDFEYELALEPQKGSVLRRELLNVAAKSKTDLKAARDEASANLGFENDWWNANKDPLWILIPGEPG